MKSAAVRDLYRYWNRLRGSGPAPRRDRVEPSEIRQILGDVFILEPVDRRTYRFRLAGTRLCATYGSELTGQNFLDLWNRADRESLTTLLAAVADDAAAAVIGITADTSAGRTGAFETVLLPLAHKGPGYRILGSMAALERPFWLGIDPVQRQQTTSLRLIWPSAAAPLPPARAARSLPAPLAKTAMQRGTRQFTVVEGGRR